MFCPRLFGQQGDGICSTSSINGPVHSINALKNSYSVGEGPGPVNHFYNYKNQNEL